MIASQRAGVRGDGDTGAAKQSPSPAHTLTRWLSRTSVSGFAVIGMLFATVLRVLPWLANDPLHRDEALYGYWARLIASGRDLLLLTPWVDKPPLVPYLLAISVHTFGASAPGLRAPGMLASLLTIAFTFGLARRVYGPRLALLAATLLACSPFAISFAPTAFTDPWLTLWLLAAAWAALSEHSFLAGLALGLAVASKQQGVLGVPLVITLLLISGRKQMAHSKSQIADGHTHKAISHTRSAIPDLPFAVLGFALIFAPMTYWDSLRWSNRPSFWDQGVAAYGGLRLAPLTQLGSRAAAWGEQIGYLFGSPLLSAMALLLAAWAGFAAWRQLAQLKTQSRKDTKTSSTDLSLAIFLCAYMALHLFATFQPWDRYLLPLVPFICILAARGLALMWDWLPKMQGPTINRSENLLRVMAIAALILGLGYGAMLGVTGKLPVGSDHGAYAGLDQVVAALRAQPANAIIYHRWLSWHYDFYLFDSPQERRWWDTGWKLAEEAGRTALIEPQRPQWVVFPGWAENTGDDEGVRLPLASNGLMLSEVKRIYRPDASLSFTLYRIIPLAQERD